MEYGECRSAKVSLSDIHIFDNVIYYTHYIVKECIYYIILEREVTNEDQKAIWFSFIWMQPM